MAGLGDVAGRPFTLDPGSTQQSKCPTELGMELLYLRPVPAHDCLCKEGERGA